MEGPTDGITSVSRACFSFRWGKVRARAARSVRCVNSVQSASVNALVGMLCAQARSTIRFDRGTSYAKLLDWHSCSIGTSSLLSCPTNDTELTAIPLSIHPLVAPCFRLSLTWYAQT